MSEKQVLYVIIDDIDLKCLGEVNNRLARLINLSIYNRIWREIFFNDGSPIRFIDFLISAQI